MLPNLSVTCLVLLCKTVISQQIASTTRYWDCSGGACGCGYRSSSGGEAHCHSNALFAAPPNNPYGALYYGSAAVSEALGGGNWLASACGNCWKVTGTSNIGSSNEATTLILKGTNFCPPSNPSCSNGRAHFDIAAPGFDFAPASLSNTCAQVEPSELAGFSSCGNWMISSSNPNENCDCSMFKSTVLRAGCENFLSLKWNNVNVSYEQITCPPELERLPCWEDNGGAWPNQLSGYCEDPGVSLFAPNPTPVAPPVTVPTPVMNPVPAPQPVTDPTPVTNPVPAPQPNPVASPVANPSDGFCSWSGCVGGAMGGPWCNESRERCRACGSGSQWCLEEVVPTNEVGFCTWQGNCNGNPEGGDWCNQSREKCISCGGSAMWCD